MKKFFIKNMGCKSNQLEGALIEENLIKNGFELSENIANSDIFILNSCTVTHKSDNEAFQILAKAKRDNPDIITVLTGCIAQIEKEKLLNNPNIDIVLGNDEKLSAAEFLNLYNEKSFNGKWKMENGKLFASEITNLDSFHQVLLTDTKKTRASLKIQDGCDNRCSYCIIPFARGKSRSADLNFILEQIKIYELAGFKEIMLTGIHIGQWGDEEAKTQRCKEALFEETGNREQGTKDAKSQDINGIFTPYASLHPSIFASKNKNLLYLLQNIEAQTTIPRYRLGSLNPLEINDEMLEFLKSSEKFCPHFHLSIQSMCDKTLKSMNRHYSVAQTLDLIEKINKTFDNIYPPFIGSDIIAGFAGETEEDFQTTIENLQKSKLTQIHTFPYSIRKGTAAENFEGHLPQNEKERRAKIIKEISAQKYAEFLKKNAGSIQEVLIEKNPDRKTGMFKGVTRNYLNVLVKPDVEFEKVKMTLQNVRIKTVEEAVLGEIV